MVSLTRITKGGEQLMALVPKRPSLLDSGQYCTPEIRVLRSDWVELCCWARYLEEMVDTAAHNGDRMQKRIRQLEEYCEGKTGSVPKEEDN
jgi:hypothetical protein